MLPEESTVATEQPIPATPEAAPEIDAAKVMEELDTATRSGDTATVKRINDQLNGVAPAEKPSETPAEVVAPAQVKKKFKVKWDGAEIERDDDDTYLGYGSHGSLKRNTVIAEQRYKKLKAEFDAALEKLNVTTTEAQNARGERDRLRQEYDERIRGLQTPAAAPVPTPTSAPTPVVAEEDLDPPAFPEDLPDDQLDYTPAHQKALNKYLRDTATFNKKLAALRRKPEAQAPDTAETPRERMLREENARLKSEAEDRGRKDQESAADRKRNEEAEAIRKQHDAVWNAAAEFQGTHKDYGTPKALREIHTDVLNWMDQLAEANGVSQPSRLTGTTADLQNYNARRAQVVKAFLAGDKSVLENSDGVRAPEGYQQYFDIADLVEYKNKLVTGNIFAPGVDLHTVWLYKQDREGGLDQATTHLTAEATRRGSQSVLDAMTNQQREFARNIPSHSPSLAPEHGGNPDAEAKILEMASTTEGMREIYGDPELKKQYRELMSRYA